MAEDNVDTTPRCSACGSERIIPDVGIVDQGQGSDGQLKALVYGKPRAILFKERTFSRIVAQVCGDCGFTELRVTQPQALYAAYEQALAEEAGRRASAKEAMPRPEEIFGEIQET
jgi:hypothetical protein